VSARLLASVLADGLRGLLRGRGLTLAALAVIALTFSVSSMALLAADNLAAAVARYGRPGSLRVYFGEGSTVQAAEALARLARQQPGVTAVTVIDPDTARERFLASFPEMAPGVSALDENPFPPRLELSAAGLAREERRALRERLANAPGVAAVLGDDLWTERLLALSGLVRRAGLAAGLAFALAAALVVAGVIRLSLASRQAEIAVMWVVGAPRAFISGPFVVEGVLLGALGALLAWGASFGLFRAAGVLAAEHPLLAFLALVPPGAGPALFLTGCAILAGVGGALLAVFQAGRGR
jgi:cell division transport system permease protein